MNLSRMFVLPKRTARHPQVCRTVCLMTLLMSFLLIAPALAEEKAAISMESITVTAV